MSSKKDNILNAKDLTFEFDEPENDDLENEEEFSDEELAITAENVEEVYPTYFPPKNTPEESYAQIIADLEFGAQYAPEFSQNDRTIMSKTVAQAYLAKVYAERTPQNHAKVIEYADKVIGTAGLALEPNYETLWGFDNGDCVKRNTSEGILELHWSVGAGTWASWMFGRCLENPEYYFTWAKWVTPSRDLVSDFEREGDQIRLDQTVHFESCTWSNYYPADNYAFMHKMPTNISSIIMMRLGEIYLLHAEALCMENDLDGAAGYVNKIRQRASLFFINYHKFAVTNNSSIRVCCIIFDACPWSLSSSLRYYCCFCIICCCQAENK